MASAADVEPTADEDEHVHIARILDDFFTRPAPPATTHEEWLLRMAASLMEREASLVSVRDAVGRARARARRRCKTETPSSTA